MYTQLFRIGLIAISAILIHSIFNLHPIVSLSEQIQYPLIIGITPYFISKLPILGTRNLMASGTQPLIALTFMILSTIVIQFISRQIKYSKQTDWLSEYIKKEEFDLNGFKIKSDFLFVLTFVLLSEFLFQMISSRKKKQDLENIVIRALKKYHGK